MTTIAPSPWAALEPRTAGPRVPWGRRQLGPRLLACDLDGTLLDPSGCVRPAVRAAIRAVRSAGVLVVLATGRSVWDAAPAAETLGLDGPQIVMDGGALMRPDEERVVWANRMAPGLVLETVWFAREAGIAPLFGFPHGHACEAPAGLQPLVPDFARTPRLRVVRHLEEAAGQGPVRVYLPTRPDEHAHILDTARWWFGDEASVVWGDRNGFEVMNPGTNKGSALSRFAESLGIERVDVAAIGDGPNDQEMLTYAGRAAVMRPATSSSPAPELARWARTLVLPSCAEDGVVEAIRQWLPDVLC